MGEDEEADAEDAADLRTEVLEVDIGEVFYLELDAGGDHDLVWVLVDVQDTETLLELLDLLLGRSGSALEHG